MNKYTTSILNLLNMARSDLEGIASMEIYDGLLRKAIGIVIKVTALITCVLVAGLTELVQCMDEF